MSAEAFYDVAVIGYGPTGATAANMLGKLGLKVLVIERDPDIYARARAISTDEEVMRIWQSIGLADRLQRDMLAERPLSWVDAHGEPFFETTVTTQGAGHPPQLFIYQPAVDEVLRDGVARYPNVELLLECECVRVKAVSDHVELLVADLPTDTFTRVRASYVIAADGGSSPTRGQLGVGYAGKTHAERWVVIDTKVLQEWDSQDRLRFHCDPARPMVDCPTPLGHHRWEFPAHPGESDEKLVHPDEVWKVLNSGGITDQQVEVQRAVVYSHHVRVADRWRVGRVFLAGDAAHAMPPWIGQGMSAGVRDAANLCWKIAAVVRGQAPDSLLDSYQTERLPHVTEVTRRAVFVGRIINERRRAVAAVRNYLLRNVSRIPGVLTGSQRLWWIPKARFDKGFFAGKHAAIGWQIPQPWVLDENGSRVRLDDVVGGEWTLLYVGAAPAGAQLWAERGARVIRLAGADAHAHPGVVRDADGTLISWLQAKKASAVILRPDGFIYTATDFRGPLPQPPVGLTLTHVPASPEQTRTGASA